MVENPAATDTATTTAANDGDPITLEMEIGSPSLGLVYVLKGFSSAAQFLGGQKKLTSVYYSTGSAWIQNG